MRRGDAMRVLRDLVTDDDVVVLGIGGTNVDWLALGIRDLDFSIYAAMGLAQSFGLGMALAQPDRRVLVLEGDGGVLMSLGAMASAADQAPPNLKHFVFVNRSWGATGNQPLPNAAHLDFAAAARAVGATGYHACTLDELRQIAERVLGEPGYAVVGVETDRSGIKDFPPEVKHDMPIDQRSRFLHAIAHHR
jgi:sulfopyruvate decarboxylase subunit beta